MFKELEGQTENIRLNCVELVYFMRGAISYDGMMDMTPTERKLVAKFLDKRMEIEGKRTNPVY